MMELEDGQLVAVRDEDGAQPGRSEDRGNGGAGEAGSACHGCEESDEAPPPYSQYMEVW